jgi:hypothetical protein
VATSFLPSPVKSPAANDSTCAATVVFLGPEKMPPLLPMNVEIEASL